MSGRSASNRSVPASTPEARSRTGLAQRPRISSALSAAEQQRILTLPDALHDASGAEQRRYYEELVARHEDILARAKASLASTTPIQSQTVRDRLQRDHTLIYVERAEQQLAVLRTQVDELTE